MIKQLKESEAEKKQLKAYIGDMKSHIPVYVPVRDDAIDVKMAEFINSFSDRKKLRVMFNRETEGIYSFGTKRVGIKLAKDMLSVWTGTNYMPIDLFIETYTTSEAAKMPSTFNKMNRSGKSANKQAI